MRVYIFVWNAGKLSICESVSKEVAEKNRARFYQRWFREECAIPDFFGEIRRVIENDKIDLAVIYTVEAGSGYFHKELLPKEMESLSFSQLVRYQEGRTSEPGVVQVSAYIRDDQLPKVIKVYDDRARICSFEDSLLKRVGGSFGFRIEFREIGSVGFMALSLPEATESILYSSEAQRVRYRRTVTHANNLCVSAALEQMWDTLGTEAPIVGFIFGDLNYQVNWPKEFDRRDARTVRDLTYSKARAYDELARQFEQDGVLSEYQEGVNGTGPTFPPDYPHLINRSADCQKKGTCLDYRRGEPAWTSRILYSNPLPEISAAKCLRYDRFDFGNTRLSAHVGVYGIFNIELS